MCSRRNFDFAPLREEDVPQNQNSGSAHFFYIAVWLKIIDKKKTSTLHFFCDKFILHKNIKTARRRRGCCHKW